MNIFPIKNSFVLKNSYKNILKCYKYLPVYSSIPDIYALKKNMLVTDGKMIILTYKIIVKIIV